MGTVLRTRSSDIIINARSRLVCDITYRVSAISTSDPSSPIGAVKLSLENDGSRVRVVRENVRTHNPIAKLAIAKGSSKF